ncbi:hypothetical protein K445DRAFT_26633 [Daldinia sp. EC12]|nr:hypothetical protein K445DRAFT_26633 [Daldinia sp. EC12]
MEEIRASCFVSTNGKDGKGIFIIDNEGNDPEALCDGRVVIRNICTTTYKGLFDMNDGGDLHDARHDKPPIHLPNGIVVRLVYFAPGVETPLHQTMSTDYCTVVSGKLLVTLDSGENRVMLPGDTYVNRGCMHKWKNIDKTRPACLTATLLGVVSLGAPLGD